MPIALQHDQETELVPWSTTISPECHVHPRSPSLDSKLNGKPHCTQTASRVECIPRTQGFEPRLDLRQQDQMPLDVSALSSWSKHFLHCGNQAGWSNADDDGSTNEGVHIIKNIMACVTQMTAAPSQKRRTTGNSAHGPEGSASDLAATPLGRQHRLGLSERAPPGNSPF